MNRKLYLALTLVFSILGFADSWYLAQHELTDTALSCGIGSTLSGCNIVAQSPYSHLFGIPLGVYGLVFYGIILLFTLAMYAGHKRRLSQLLFVVAVVGTLLSFYFASLQIFVIKAICIYCFGSFFLTIGIFVTTLMLARHKPAAPPLM